MLMGLSSINAAWKGCCYLVRLAGIGSHARSRLSSTHGKLIVGLHDVPPTVDPLGTWGEIVEALWRVAMSLDDEVGRVEDARCISKKEKCL
jgi:hypothetical protein